MKTILLLCFPISVLLSQQPGKDAALFDFTSDIRVFTSHAFMNAAGNDGEWRSAGMHPLRIAIRKQLEGRLDSTFLQRIRKFNFGHHRGSWSGYAPYVLITSGPPDFPLAFDSSTSDEDCRNIAKSYAGLSILLSEFYRKANVTELWQKYQPLIQAENDRFKGYAPNALDDIESYCRLTKGFFSKASSRIHYQFSPLMLYYTAQTVKVNGDIWIIEGPQDGTPDESSFYHEALHHVVNPLVDALDSTTVNKFADLFRLADTTSEVDYDQLHEGFVRTLDKVIGGKRFRQSDSTVRAKVTNEYKLGFMLCLPIYEELKKYETSSMTFAEYFPKIIASIDVNREKQRWREFTKSSK